MNKCIVCGKEECFVHCWSCGGILPPSTGKRKRHFCNDKCRVAYNRKKVSEQEAEQAKSEQIKTEQIKTEQPKANKIPTYAVPYGITGEPKDLVVADKIPTYELVPDVKIYGRRAVRYKVLREVWDLRPEPLSPEDRPKPLNRGRYIRPDGSEYQFDAIGKVFEQAPYGPHGKYTPGVPGSFELPANFGQPDCECRHCQGNRAGGKPYTLNHGPYKTTAELAKNEINRVALPGDVDYAGG